MAPPHRQSSTLSRTHLMMCVLAFAMAMRALIPTGFMPDANALRLGKLAISFCSVDGTMTTSMVDLNDLADAGTTDHDTSHASAACAFSTVGQPATDLPRPRLAAPTAVARLSYPALFYRAPAPLHAWTASRARAPPQRG